MSETLEDAVVRRSVEFERCRKEAMDEFGLPLTGAEARLWQRACGYEASIAEARIQELEELVADMERRKDDPVWDRLTALAKKIEAAGSPNYDQALERITELEEALESMYWLAISGPDTSDPHGVILGAKQLLRETIKQEETAAEKAEEPTGE